MPIHEGLRQAKEAVVVCTLPDVCLTPFLGINISIPYVIFAKFDDATEIESNILFNEKPAFSMKSRVTRVIGNEAGTGGGVVSGVNQGYCRPITANSVVQVNDEFVCFHSSDFWMNCNGPEGLGNTRGKAVFITTISLGDVLQDNPAILDNFPYEAETFAKIASMRKDILELSQKYDIPPVTVAGAIADEFNASGFLDQGQDKLFDHLPDFIVESDLFFDSKNKFIKKLNARRHDLGPGNINVETAFNVYKNNIQEFPSSDWDYSDIIDYITTDFGTVHIAALFIQDAKKHFEPLTKDLSPEIKEAVFVTSYKRGIENYKLEEALQQEPFKPGEGIRVLLQREQLLEALGLSPKFGKDGIMISG